MVDNAANATVDSIRGAALQELRPMPHLDAADVAREYLANQRHTEREAARTPDEIDREDIEDED